jgi:integrase
VAALFLSGLRRSELSRLRAEDLLPEKGKIFVQGNNRNEELAVNAEAMAVLQRMSARVDDKGELVPGGVEEIVRVFKTRSERHGINLRAHDLRRAFVTALIRAGHDIATVARYSRHTSDEIRRYMAANEDDKRVLAAVTIEGPAKPAAKKGRVRMRKVE